MYGGCALSMEQSEAPPKAAADSRVGCASGLALRAAASGGQPPGLAVVSDLRCAFERHRALARHYNAERCR